MNLDGWWNYTWYHKSVSHKGFFFFKEKDNIKQHAQLFYNTQTLINYISNLIANADPKREKTQEQKDF